MQCSGPLPRGEPLLCFDTISQIIETIHAKTYSPYVAWYIQTNGVLLTQEVLDYFRERNVGIGISLDGASDRSNICRQSVSQKPTTDLTLNALRLLKENKIPTSILTVVNANNYSTVLSDIAIYMNLGVRNIALNPYISAGRGAIAQLGVTNDQMFELFKSLIGFIISEYSNSGTILVEKNLFHIVKKVVTHRNSYMCMSNPCGAGLAQFTIDPCGYVYPCADLCGQENFCLGHITEDFFEAIPSCSGWREIRSYSLTAQSTCADCGIVDVCPAGCAVRCYYSNGCVHSTDPLCTFYKLLIPYLKQSGLLHTLYEIYNGKNF